MDSWARIQSPDCTSRPESFPQEGGHTVKGRHAVGDSARRCKKSMRVTGEVVVLYPRAGFG